MEEWGIRFPESNIAPEVKAYLSVLSKPSFWTTHRTTFRMFPWISNKNAEMTKWQTGETKLEHQKNQLIFPSLGGADNRRSWWISFRITLWWKAMVLQSTAVNASSAWCLVLDLTDGRWSFFLLKTALEFWWCCWDMYLKCMYVKFGCSEWSIHKCVHATYFMYCIWYDNQ